MWVRWFPWTFFLRRAAQARGFLDPFKILAQVNHFAQSSELPGPVELLRSGVVLHARGLLNTQAIQHNLDWIWPYWVERQFDPHDEAFIPRAFSFTHLNLTHRNWTGIGLPGCDAIPIVDPRGLLTPLYDGWSLDFWIVPKDYNGSADAPALFPSLCKVFQQRFNFENTVSITNNCALEGMSLSTEIFVRNADQNISCSVELQGSTDRPSWLIISFRPYNPEGVSLIHNIESDPSRTHWKINGTLAAKVSAPPEKVVFSTYRLGDALGRINRDETEEHAHCPVGMASALAMYSIEGQSSREVRIDIPLKEQEHITSSSCSSYLNSWEKTFSSCSRLTIPNAQYQFLYEASLRTLILLSPHDVYPGPYTYKRFWFRDAAFILHALLCVGFTEQVELALSRFPSRQTKAGYFLSQEGEWDSNGQVIWILRRYGELTGKTLPAELLHAVRIGARWIIEKRLPDNLDRPHAGLLPAGFSAEHFGPNDFYFWDDFWALEGLLSASSLMSKIEDKVAAQIFLEESEQLQISLKRSLDIAINSNAYQAIPASVYRRMDAGAIGNIVGTYPLNFFEANDPSLKNTLRYLISHCFVHGGFFQDMIHSGINAYLTLHIAQALLRAGDLKFFDLMKTVAELASPTGQWPEAIHPKTLGGCMGDGQHAWASAEWILLIRNCFVREEKEELIIGSGISPEWLQSDKPLFFGPTLTAFGQISVSISNIANSIHVHLDAQWHDQPPQVKIQLPGFKPLFSRGDISDFKLQKQ